MPTERDDIKELAAVLQEHLKLTGELYKNFRAFLATMAEKDETLKSSYERNLSAAKENKITSTEIPKLLHRVQAILERGF